MPRKVPTTGASDKPARPKIKFKRPKLLADGTAPSKPKRKSSNPAKKSVRRKAPLKMRLPLDAQYAKIGRKPVYDVNLCPRVTNFALLGMTDSEIAYAIGIADETFYAWSRRHRAFSDAVTEGREKADSEVAATMFNLATGKVRMPAVKVFYDKDKGEAIYAPYVEAIPPNVVAQKLWLTNRQPQKWRERKEIEVSGALEHRIAQMTPDERLARLKELQAKATLVIEGEAVEVEGEE